MWDEHLAWIYISNITTLTRAWKIKYAKPLETIRNGDYSWKLQQKTTTKGNILEEDE